MFRTKGPHDVGLEPIKLFAEPMRF